jgi:hypothetical protein
MASYHRAAMTTHTFVVPPKAGTLGLSRAGLGSSRIETAAAIALYSAISMLFFGLPALAHLGSSCACGAGPDPTMFMWSLEWWPHALLHGIDPFVTSAVFAPDRLQIGGVTTIPGAALVASPVTLAFGPIVSFNLLMLASPVLAAVFAFLLCRYVCRSFAAALFGGYVFGFSAYMLGHMLVHLNLVLIFPIPAGVHLVLRLIDGRIPARRFIALLGLDLAALLMFSTELALTFVLLGALSFGVALAVLREDRARLRAVVGPTVLAGVLAALVASPIIYFSLRGQTAGFGGIGDLYGGDPLGFVVPSPIIGLWGGAFTSVSKTFNGGNFAESGIYLGAPLVAVLAYYSVTHWRIPATRVMVITLVAITLLLLGSHLKVDGHETVALPWRWLGQLPLVREVSPVRLALYIYLIASVIVSLWLAERPGGALGLAKWLVALLCVLTIVPNLRQGLWGGARSNPTFFTNGDYKRYVPRNATVLALPWSWRGNSELWQAETGMWFRLAGGYLGKLVPDDYLREPIVPALLAGRTSAAPAELLSFLRTRNVSLVIIDSAHPGRWPAVLASLGVRPVPVDGVLFYRLPSFAPMTTSGAA